MKGLRPLVVLLAASGCDAAGERPGLVVFPGMAYSIPYDAYDANPITGQTLLHAPEGTVAVGASPFSYGPGPAEALRAGTDLQNPFADSERVVAQLPRGKKMYDRFCLVCHGPAGAGDGPIIGRFPNPPSLLAERSKALPDGHVYHIIYHGRGLMPGYAAQVLPKDRWRIITYLRWLQALTEPQP